jgi:hypothetical protein
MPTATWHRPGAELAASSQRNCILYVNAFDAGRRSGNTHRTSFMYNALENLGYSGYYDVYDQAGVRQRQLPGWRPRQRRPGRGYSLIIQDTGQQRSNTLTNAASFDFKVDQSSWYRSYLAQGVSGLAGTATLWILGNNVAEEFPADPLLATDMGLTGVTGNQGLTANPDVKGRRELHVPHRLHRQLQHGCIQPLGWLSRWRRLRRAGCDRDRGHHAPLLLRRDFGRRRRGHEQELDPEMEQRVHGLQLVRHPRRFRPARPAPARTR